MEFEQAMNLKIPVADTHFPVIGNAAGDAEIH